METDNRKFPVGGSSSKYQSAPPARPRDDLAADFLRAVAANLPEGHLFKSMELESQYAFDDAGMTVTHIVKVRLDSAIVQTSKR